MHHKFAIFDESTLLTGSYNWTLSAMRHNEENLIVTDDAALVRRFAEVFTSLWEQWV
jgi:phosphatidylserine/phosphatidylglycerophosphate/cardiolipin synthase-like enzyme